MIVHRMKRIAKQHIGVKTSMVASITKTRIIMKHIRHDDFDGNYDNHI